MVGYVHREKTEREISMEFVWNVERFLHFYRCVWDIAFYMRDFIHLALPTVNISLTNSMKRHKEFKVDDVYQREMVVVTLSVDTSLFTT